ncbi:phospholipase D-like domain-containing protein [Burkholderia arboris]|uniref:phospholipase D-like domain-containing protein n=1 Tax=Burkholderia arboris TaxID=488730 RepID=UPI00158F500E|nr:phospholipase D-like domain-containing protein [Burkholderia arboris]
MAMPNNTFTTPLALNHTSNATATLPWFLQFTEYAAKQATFRPLVNGKEAFETLYDVLMKARHTIDIICWGFQPSMYFKRDGNSLRIGELLEQKGQKGVKIRLLCWRDPLYLTELGENNMPGYDVVTGLKQHISDDTYRRSTMLSRDYQTDEERKFDTEWYWRADLNNVTSVSLVSPVTPLKPMAKLAYEKARALYYKDHALKNVVFATRGFSPANRAEIAWRTFWHGKDKDRDLETKAMNSVGMGAGIPTHHQKMVLVDYEDPENAVGFVMGHNMLDQYWDTDDHSYKPKTPSTGRNGPSPWQDISSYVTGPVLQYLNANFCQAWDDATGQGLGKARDGLKDRLKVRYAPGGDTPMMAQIVRTQSQKGRRDIEKLYLQAVNNATQHVFIQNQYFRWPPLANAIKAVAAKHVSWGRNVTKDGPLYLFAITNSGEEAVGTGTVNTYRMLNALGKAQSIPGVATLEQEDARQSDLKNQMAAVVDQQSQANQALLGAFEVQGIVDSPDSAKRVADAKARIEQLKQRRESIASQMKSAPQPVLNKEYDGLKVHVCTLVAPDSPPGNWVPVYVHAKLMTIDDVFTTLGSANINTRSMEADSELNICHENGDVTKRLRQQLWSLHTNKEGMQDAPAEAFTTWTDIVKKNADRQDGGVKSPYASIVRFMRMSNERTYKD